MAQYNCMQCDYVYDEAEHGPVLELTDDYVCPNCGTNKTWLVRSQPIEE